MRKYIVNHEVSVAREALVPYLRSCALEVDGRRYSWSTAEDRIRLSRKGILYSALEVVGDKAGLPIWRMQELLGLAQTTYNKKKRNMDTLPVRDGELVLAISEVLDYGVRVFNEEVEKFHLWIKKKNISLGSVSPESLMDTMTGVKEVRNALDRLEYGSMA